MSIIKTVLLGFVQGATEFLPVSSSGHLLLAEKIWSVQSSRTDLTLEILLHFGTLFAVLVYFRKDIFNLIISLKYAPDFFLKKNDTAQDNPGIQNFRLTLLILLSSLPAGIIGVFFNSRIESFFSRALFLVPVALMLNGVFLFLSRFIPERDCDQIRFRDALLIGAAQAVAIIPGISRSGATIVTGMFLKYKRDTAARFSFLMSVPVIGGASLLKVKDLIKAGISSRQWLEYGMGVLAAALVGYLCIILLLAVIKRGRLQLFGCYTFAAGLAALIFFLAR